MNLKKCPNGHFYDGDTYSTCPHCSAGGGEVNATVSLDSTISDVGVTESYDDVSVGGNLTDLVNNASKPAAANSMAADDQKTISFNSFSGADSMEEDMDPVVGWLVCVKGGPAGKDFRLKSGRNFIGRSENMDVCLRGEMKVSRDRHAIVVYEPKQSIFLAMPGETKELAYLNGNVVLTPTQMQKNDILQVGDVLLMLIPFCDSDFTWKDADKLEI